LPFKTPPGTAIKSYKVDHEHHEAKLDEFLSKMAGFRRSLARVKILNGEVDVVGSTHAQYVDLKPNGILHAGDVVRVLLPEGKQKVVTAKDLQSTPDAQKLKKQVLVGLS
jgi:ribosomal 50S subunit-recycling heat shock protein